MARHQRKDMRARGSTRLGELVPGFVRGALLCGVAFPCLALALYMLIAFLNFPNNCRPGFVP